MRIKLILTAIAVALLSSCAGGPYPMPGAIFTDHMGPNQARDNDASGKKGESCAMNILSLVSMGDASIKAAKENGGITKVSAVDYKNFGVLGLYSETCTIVSGN